MATLSKTFQFDRTVLVITVSTGGAMDMIANPLRTDNTRYSDKVLLSSGDRTNLRIGVHQMMSQIGDTVGIANDLASYGPLSHAASQFWPQFAPGYGALA